jgi:hypothetical protein
MRKTDRNDLSALADRLKLYNEWRRGAETEMTHPTQIGQDIDAAIMIVEELIIEGVNNV